MTGEGRGLLARWNAIAYQDIQMRGDDLALEVLDIEVASLLTEEDHAHDLLVDTLLLRLIDRDIEVHHLFLTFHVHLFLLVGMTVIEDVRGHGRGRILLEGDLDLPNEYYLLEDTLLQGIIIFESDRERDHDRGRNIERRQKAGRNAERDPVLLDHLSVKSLLLKRKLKNH